MRMSPHRHTLAILRTLLKLTQKEMADLLKCSRPTIQAIELGKLKLSDGLAGRICDETGVDLKWLLDNDVTRPPTTASGTPFSPSSFAQHQSRLRGEGPVDFLDVQSISLRMTADFLALLLSAYERGQARLFTYKASKAADLLEKEFGINKAVAECGRGDTVGLDIGPCQSLLSQFARENTRIYAAKLKKDKRARLLFHQMLMVGRIQERVDLKELEKHFPGVTKITASDKAELIKAFPAFYRSSKAADSTPASSPTGNKLPAKNSK